MLKKWTNSLSYKFTVHLPLIYCSPILKDHNVIIFQNSSALSHSKFSSFKRINNCVGELNQKYFIQFLFYTGERSHAHKRRRSG